MTEKTFPQWANYYASKFKNTFGFSMPYDFTGIDLFKLEGILRVPDDESMEDFITENWNKEASDLVREIINNPPPFPR